MVHVLGIRDLLAHGRELRQRLDHVAIDKHFRVWASGHGHRHLLHHALLAIHWLGLCPAIAGADARATCLKERGDLHTLAQL